MIKISNLQPLYIVGPTGSGKSNLAMEVAKKIDSVIISADSMQIYKGLDIGTAKECLENRALVPHKMVDIVNYDCDFSVAEWSEQARKHINSALENNKLPIIVGGTGLYFEALIYPYNFGNTIKDSELRKNLEEELKVNGAEYLHNKLKSLDIESANKLHPNDTKRVIRALEIVISTGKTRKENADQTIMSDVLMIGLNTERTELYNRINKRVDDMFEQGLIDEVYKVGNFNYQSMQAIGYKEFANCAYQINDNKYVIDDETLAFIKEKIKQDSRNYAKRQLTWFRKYQFIKWFDIYDTQSAIDYIIKELTKQ